MEMARSRQAVIALPQELPQVPFLLRTIPLFITQYTAKAATTSVTQIQGGRLDTAVLMVVEADMGIELVPSQIKMSNSITRTCIWRGLWLWTLLCLLVPMRYTFLKVGLVAGGTALWGLSLYLFGSKRWVRVICAFVAALVIGMLTFLLMPGRNYDLVALRRQYVRCLLAYKGTFYVWGGGNRIGIDCSGLVQRALIDADLVQAFSTQNPRLAREGLSLWWHNRSARALGAGYRGDTHLLFETPSLNAADYQAIQPGDIAVMSDGVHTLAYVGSHTWIEADPTPMRVVLATAPRNADIYFNVPVRIMRWRALETTLAT